MGGNKDSCAALIAAVKEIHNQLSTLRIKIAGGLIGQDEIRFVGNCPGNG